MLEKVGEITFIESGLTIEEQYPTLASGEPEQFTLQTDEAIYTLYIVVNFVSNRLYYKIMDTEGNYLVTYNIAAENVNLVNGTIDGYILERRKNAFYWGQQ